MSEQIKTRRKQPSVAESFFMPKYISIPDDTRNYRFFDKNTLWLQLAQFGLNLPVQASTYPQALTQETELPFINYQPFNEVRAGFCIQPSHGLFLTLHILFKC